MCEGRFHKLYLDVQSGMSYLLLWPLPLRKDLGVFKKVQGLFFKLLVLFTKLLVLFKGLYTDLLNWVCLSVSPIIFPTFFEYREFGAPDKPCGVGRADANPKLLLNDT